MSLPKWDRIAFPKSLGNQKRDDCIHEFLYSSTRDAARFDSRIDRLGNVSGSILGLHGIQADQVRLGYDQHNFF